MSRTLVKSIKNVPFLSSWFKPHHEHVSHPVHPPHTQHGHSNVPATQHSTPNKNLTLGTVGGAVKGAAKGAANVAAQNPISSLLAFNYLSSNFLSESDRLKAQRDPLSGIAATLCSAGKVVSFGQGSCEWTKYVGPVALTGGVIYLRPFGPYTLYVAVGAGTLYYFWGEGYFDSKEKD